MSPLESSHFFKESCSSPWLLTTFLSTLRTCPPSSFHTHTQHTSAGLSFSLHSFRNTPPPSFSYRAHHAKCPWPALLPFLWECLARGAKELLRRRRERSVAEVHVSDTCTQQRMATAYVLLNPNMPASDQPTEVKQALELIGISAADSTRSRTKRCRPGGSVGLSDRPSSPTTQ